jgi:hypothetical protein
MGGGGGGGGLQISLLFLNEHGLDAGLTRPDRKIHQETRFFY